MKNIQLLYIAFMLCSLSAFSGNTYRVQNNALILPSDIQFDTHNYDVKDEDDPMLNFVAQYLLERPNITKLRIEGHVYTESSHEENMKLSLQRSAMISYYLTTKGVSCNRLVPVAFGDTKPIAPTDECNLDTNTRIDFYNAELNNKAIYGNAVDGFALKVFDPCE